MAKFIAPLTSELRHKMIIQSLGDKASDGAGGFTAQWVDVVTVWVRKIAWKGREVLATNQAKSSALFEVDMRYRPGINTTMRMIDANADTQGRQYDIRFVTDPDETRNWLHLSIEAVKQK